MANKIVIEVDYKDSVVKLNDLEGKLKDLTIPFDELNTATQQSSRLVKKAVDQMSDAVAGSVKSLQRQRAEYQNILDSTSKTNKAYRENKQVIDELDARIAKLTDTRTKAEKAADKQAEAEKQLGTAIKGSAGWYKEQIRLLELEQNNRTKSNKAYRASQREIDRLKAEYDKLTNTMKVHETAQEGSVAAIRKEIAALKQKQDNLSQSNEEYRKAQVQIDALNAQLNELTDTRKEEEIAVEGSMASYNNLIAKLEQERDNLAQNKEEYDRYEQQIAKVRQQQGNLSNTFADATKAQVSHSHSAGAAGASLTEFSRIIQDSPYGLIGMANNVEQLTGQLADLTVKTGGVKNAAKALFASFMKGPNALLIGISIITALTVTLSRRKKEAAEQTEELSDSMLLENKTLSNLIEMYDRANESSSERLGIINALSKADRDFANAMARVAGDQARRNQLADDYFRIQKEILRLENLRNKAFGDNKELLEESVLSEEEYNNAVRQQDEALQDIIKSIKSLYLLELPLQVKSFMNLRKIVNEDKEREEVLKSINKETVELASKQAELDRLLMRGAYSKAAEDVKDYRFELSLLYKFGDDELSILEAKRKKIGEKMAEEAVASGTTETEAYQRLLLEQMRIQYEIDKKKKDIEKAAREERLERETEFQEELGDMMEQYFMRYDQIGKQQVELDRVKALERAKQAEATEEEILFINEYYDSLIRDIDQAQTEERISNLKKYKDEAKTNLDEQYEDNKEYFDKWLTARKESIDKGFEYEQQKFEEIMGVMQQAETIFDELSAIAEARFQRQIGQIQARRDIIKADDQLDKEEKERLLNELQLKENEVQTARIKAERDMFTAKQSFLLAEIIMKERLAFIDWKNTQKKMALDNMVMANMQKLNAVYLAENAKIQAATTAADAKQAMTTIGIDSTEGILKAQMSIGEYMKQLGPLGIAAFALSIGSVIASIVKARKAAKAEIAGLTGVGATGGGSTSTPSIPPDFRVVGASGVNQLAEVINGQQQQPVKAYVVSDDVSSAQALDRNIVQGASI
jgi:hypothetical protein